MRRALQNLALLIGVCIVCLGAAELVFRTIVPVDTGTSFMFRRPHATLGWALEPNVAYTNVIREPPVSITKVRVTHNARGYHDTEHPHARPQGSMRVLVLGDSFMEGYSVGDGATLARRLEAELSARGADAEVVNLGVGGYGTLQEYLTWRTVGRAYAPDVVVLAMYLDNDLRDNDAIIDAFLDPNRSAARPYLAPGEPWRVLAPADYEGATRRYEAARARREQGWRGWARRSSLAAKALDIVDRAAGTRGAAHARTSSLAAGLDDVTARFGVHLCAPSPHYERAWSTTRRALTRLARDVEAAGAQFVVLYVPALHEVDPAQIEDVEGKGAPGQLCLQDPIARDRLLGITAELGIPTVDVLDDFRARTKAGERLYWTADRHWNAEGHAAAAARLAEVIAQARRP